MERNVVIESFSVSEHIAGIVNGFSSDLLIHSPSKSFVNRCETRLRLLLLFLVCSLFNFVSLKAHQGLIAGTYTAEFDYDVVGTLGAARYDEVDILYKLPDRIGNIYPDRFGKEATYERGGRRKEDKEWTYHFDGEGFLTQRVSKTESIERYDWIHRNYDDDYQYKRISCFLNDEDFCYFIAELDVTHIFKARVADVVFIIGECSFFEYYVVSMDLKKLICETEHGDFLEITI